MAILYNCIVILYLFGGPSLKIHWPFCKLYCNFDTYLVAMDFWKPLAMVSSGHCILEALLAHGQV